MIYAIDTNVVIDILNKRADVVKRFNNIISNNGNIVIPSVVNYEIIRGFYHTPIPRKEVVYTNIRINCSVINVNADIWDCAARMWAALRKNGITVGDADIIIAATCIINGYTLVTHNIKDFINISDLNTEDWAS